MKQYTCEKDGTIYKGEDGSITIKNWRFRIYKCVDSTQPELTAYIHVGKNGGEKSILKVW